MPIFWKQNKEIIINVSSAEYFQRVVMVKDKPYLCMSENGFNHESYQKILGTIRFQTSKLVDIFFQLSRHFSALLTAI